MEKCNLCFKESDTCQIVYFSIDDDGYYWGFFDKICIGCLRIMRILEDRDVFNSIDTLTELQFENHYANPKNNEWYDYNNGEVYFE